ncbi:MAG: ABC transporter transmembrane domain-containing protein [Candidatus Omnitrophica bacterium]|nr:ABC transporter transmembrane domain-containing protein [Candidatus Omnitrophota bacterium]
MIGFFRQLWSLVKPYRVRITLGVLTGVICGVIEPIMILTITFVFNVIFPGSGMASLDQIFKRAPQWLQEWIGHLLSAQAGTAPRGIVTLLLVSTIPAIMLLRGLFGYLNIYLLQWAAIRAITDLRTRLFGHLIRLSSGFFTRSSTGELTSRIAGDTAALQGILSNALSVIIKDPVKLISLLTFLLWTQPKLTLISMVVLPFCLSPIVIYSRKVRHSSAAIQTHFAELINLMMESFTGNRIIKAYNLEDMVIRQFRETSRKFISHYMRVVRSSEIPGPLLEFFGAVGVSMVFLYLAFQTGPRTSSGDFMAVVLAIWSMYAPLKSLIRLHSQLEQARAASQRVFELLATSSSVLEPAKPKSLNGAKADIHFDGVQFAYGEKPVLRDIKLKVQAGQIVALVGSSGSGKTTLANLLLRFYDPQKGTVRIGLTDIRSVSTHDLRSQIAVVTQEAILFNDTIRNNILLGAPGASDREIEAAAKHAHAHGFIMEKPQGYDSVIGEKGVNLSGGQRQRIAIARAILKNAPILILDEATSALDTESERAVQAALEELMEGRTTLCIAHRLSTIQNADVIIVLDQGRIVEQGRHAELVQGGGVYQKLYEMQFRNLPPSNGRDLGTNQLNQFR